MPRVHVSRLYAAAGVDLVEVNAKADPPVCRLRDSVQMEKKEAERKSKAQKQARVDKGQMKKIRLSPRTDDGGILVKGGQISKMLRKGQTVQVFVFANTHKDKLIVHDKAMPLLSQLFDQVYAICEEDGCCWYREEPGFRGNQYTMTLVSTKPKGGARKGAKAQRAAVQPLESMPIAGGGGLRLVLLDSTNLSSELLPLPACLSRPPFLLPLRPAGTAEGLLAAGQPSC